MKGVEQEYIGFKGFFNGDTRGDFRENPQQLLNGRGQESGQCTPRRACHLGGPGVVAPRARACALRADPAGSRRVPGLPGVMGKREQGRPRVVA